MTGDERQDPSTSVPSVACPLAMILGQYEPISADEASDVARVRSLAAGPDPFGRSSPLHITASALVVHPPTGRVLLRWHQRQQAWLQIGGHADPGEDDPLAVARREGVEETGLPDLAPWPNGALQHVAIVPVPANDREAAHHHADLRFFLSTATPDAVRPENPNAELRWLSPDDATALTTEENVRETIRRAARLLAAPS